MKRFILSLIFVLITIFGFAQPRHFNYHMVKPNIDLTQYSVVDSLPLERIMIHFDKEIDDDSLISLGYGDYMAQVPRKDNMIIKFNEDRSKAIIVYNSYAWGRHFEFNVENTERRTTFWYKDNKIYCGYVYDKKYKVCKYFESKKEYKRFMRHRFFERY